MQALLKLFPCSMQPTQAHERMLAQYRGSHGNARDLTICHAAGTMFTSFIPAYDWLAVGNGKHSSHKLARVVHVLQMACAIHSSMTCCHQQHSMLSLQQQRPKDQLEAQCWTLEWALRICFWDRPQAGNSLHCHHISHQRQMGTALTARAMPEAW